jgi:hypothetical protein
VSPARLILEIDIGEPLPGAVRHDEGGANILDCPRRREAARESMDSVSIIGVEPLLY